MDTYGAQVKLWEKELCKYFDKKFIALLFALDNLQIAIYVELFVIIHMQKIVQI